MRANLLEDPRSASVLPGMISGPGASAAGRMTAVMTTAPPTPITTKAEKIAEPTTRYDA
jgi:hypothetical protein